METNRDWPTLGVLDVLDDLPPQSSFAEVLEPIPKGFRSEPFVGVLRAE
jgi:hypothetical protein